MAAPIVTANALSPDSIIIESRQKQRSEQLSTAPASIVPLQSTPIRASIGKAIASRAITGIQIEYNRGTAYLSGKVQTQSQRVAAETAAKQVLGVDTVVSSIRVEWQE